MFAELQGLELCSAFGFALALYAVSPLLCHPCFPAVFVALRIVLVVLLPPSPPLLPLLLLVLMFRGASVTSTTSKPTRS